MNKQALMDGLNGLIAQDRPVAVKLFFRLTKQVWQIDWTVAAYDVLGHYLAFDIPYFWRFMALDEGDSPEEEQLIRDWVDARIKLNSEAKKALVPAIDELNQLRMTARAA